MLGGYTAGRAVVAFSTGAGAFGERGVWVLKKPDVVAEEPRGTQMTHALLAVAALLTHLHRTPRRVNSSPLPCFKA